jgi:hypothetical protein
MRLIVVGVSRGFDGRSNRRNVANDCVIASRRATMCWGKLERDGSRSYTSQPDASTPMRCAPVDGVYPSNHMAAHMMEPRRAAPCACRRICAHVLIREYGGRDLDVLEKRSFSEPPPFGVQALKIRPCCGDSVPSSKK